MILFILLFGFLVGIIGIIKPKYSKVCGAITLFALFFTMVFNNGNVDYLSYANNYNSSKFEHDVLFNTLELFFKTLGASYDQFVIVTMFIAFLIMTVAVYRLNINPCAFCFLYFLYPFCLDVIQVRNFLGYAIVFFALPWLLSDSIKGKLFYIIFVLIASCIHFECVVYSLAVFYPLFKKYRSARIILYMSIGFMILLSLDTGFLTGYLNIFQENVYRIFNETRVYEMSMDDIGERGYLIFYAVHFVNIIIQVIMFKNFKIEKQSNYIGVRLGALSSCKKYKRYVEIVMWLNILLTIFIPLYRFQATLFRITRNLMIINYSSILVFFRYGRSNKTQKSVVSLLSLLLPAFMFWFEVIREPNYIKILVPVLQNNWLNFTSGFEANAFLIALLSFFFAVAVFKMCHKRYKISFNRFY